MSYEDTRNRLNLIQYVQPAVLLAAVLLVGSNAFVLTPILKEVADGLKAEVFRISWAISAFGVSTAASALALGGLIDRRPVGLVLGSAAMLLALALVLSSASQDWLQLCLSQAVAGIAVGILLPGTYATAAATAPKGHEAARLGLVLTGWALSLVFAVPLAALITGAFGWRVVYMILAGFSAVVGIGLISMFSGVRRKSVARVSPWRALRLPGVVLLLIAIFAFMTAFYGSFAFFGQGVRKAFGLSPEGAGVFVLAYGLGFGLAGVGLSVVAPKISRGYIQTVFLAIAASYACWHFALGAVPAAFFAAMTWGALNQLGLNALIVSLNRCAADAQGTVMGLNSAVTYLAVFAGPLVMSPVYADWGFASVTLFASAFVVVGAIVIQSGRGPWASRLST